MKSSAEKVSAPTALVFGAGPRSRANRTGWSEKLAAIAFCGLVFAEHLLFGGGRTEVALAFDAIYGLFLAVLVVGSAWARRELDRLFAFRRTALLFGLVVLSALWSLTPWVPGGPHPLWMSVQALPAATIDKSAVTVELIKLGGLVCVFVAGLLIGAEDERARYVFRCLGLGFLVYTALAFVSHLVDPDFMFWLIPLPPGSVRLSASFLSANTAGTLFGVSTVLALCAIMEHWREQAGASLEPRLRAAAIPLVTTAFSVACLFLTASRGAAAATVAAVIVLMVWEGYARRWNVFGPAGLGLLALAGASMALFAVGGAPLLMRLAQNQNDLGRHDMAQAHWSAFMASPWLGYGLGSFDGINALVMTSANYPSLWNVHAAHNVYLQWLEEGGVLGAGAMFACLGAILWMIAKGSAQRSRMTGWLRGIVAASLVLLVHGLSDFALQVPSIAVQWAGLLGIGAGIALPRRRRA